MLTPNAKASMKDLFKELRDEPMKQGDANGEEDSLVIDSIGTKELHACFPTRGGGHGRGPRLALRLRGARGENRAAALTITSD